MADEGEEEVQPVVEWDGPLQDGIPHGSGTAKFPSGDTFTGVYVNGRREGRGRYTWASAEGEEGEGDGEKEGGGAAGGVYEGEYKDNLRHGQGTMTYPDGGKYEGNWENGRRSGEGRYTYPGTSDVYLGGWVADRKSGHGSYFFAHSMSQFVGDWAGGSLLKGSWLLRDGSSYSGPFLSNRPCGRGGEHRMGGGNVAVGGYDARGKWRTTSVRRAGRE